MIYEIISIGNYAADILKITGAAQLLSRTSSGFFILTDGKDVLFLTVEKSRGPLTINLNSESISNLIFEVNPSIRVNQNGIQIQSSGYEIRITPQTLLWQPLLKELEKECIPPFVDRCLEFTGNLFPKKRKELLTESDHSAKTLAAQKRNVFEALSRKDAHGFTSAAKNLAGLGGGLTPAGDDFLCGLLLADYYCGKCFEIDPEIAANINKIPKICGVETTLLSQSLMRCAALGSADERILNCLDWLLHERGDPDRRIEELRTYGSSSGLETLDGFLCYVAAVTSGI